MENLMLGKKLLAASLLVLLGIVVFRVVGDKKTAEEGRGVTVGRLRVILPEQFHTGDVETELENGVTLSMDMGWQDPKNREREFAGLWKGKLEYAEAMQSLYDRTRAEQVFQLDLGRDWGAPAFLVCFRSRESGVECRALVSRGDLSLELSRTVTADGTLEDAARDAVTAMKDLLARYKAGHAGAGDGAWHTRSGRLEGVAGQVRRAGAEFVWFDIPDLPSGEDMVVLQIVQRSAETAGGQSEADWPAGLFDDPAGAEVVRDGKRSAANGWNGRERIVSQKSEGSLNLLAAWASPGVPGVSGRPAVVLSMEAPSSLKDQCLGIWDAVLDSARFLP